MKTSSPDKQKPGMNPEHRTPECRTLKWPSQSEIAGKQKQDDVDREQAILASGGLPPGWKMIGGRKVKPNR